MPKRKRKRAKVGGISRSLGGRERRVMHEGEREHDQVLTSTPGGPLNECLQDERERYARNNAFAQGARRKVVLAEMALWKRAMDWKQVENLIQQDWLLGLGLGLFRVLSGGRALLNAFSFKHI